MAAPLVAAVAAGISAATGLVGGIGKAVSSNDKRPKLGPMGEDVASDLAATYASRITGTPSLGTQLGTPTSPTGTPNLLGIKQRMQNVGKNLGMG